MEYTLCGIVVHVGTSPERGRCVAFVQTSNGWYETKKREWQCLKCSTSTCKMNMISCDNCNNWFHW